MTWIHAIAEEIRGLDAGRPALRNFGLVVGGVFAVIGLVIWWVVGSWTMWTAVFIGAGTVLIVFGLAAPTALRSVYYVWMGIAVVLGFVMTRVLLTLVFVAMVVPIGFVMRMLGKDLLSRRLDPAAETYWIRRSDSEPAGKRMKRYY